MQIRKDYKEVYRHEIERQVNKEDAKEVLDLLFGTPFSEGYEIKYRVFHRGNPYVKSTKVQRMNMLWAVPFTVLCMPFQYVSRGEFGWDDKTKLGRFILKCTGYIKEDSE